jgi:hypothetical protein
MRKEKGLNSKPSKEDLDIEIITTDLLICENLIHQRQD